MRHSEQIDQIATALAKAQAVMGGAKKDSENPFFKSKYADLASVVDAIKKPFADSGLSYAQGVDISEDGAVVVTTIIMHASGQWYESQLGMKPAKATPQDIGSTITYGRRYGLQAMAGLPTEDDDGNAGSDRASGQEYAGRRPANQQARPAPKAAPVETETQDQAFDYAEKALLLAGVDVTRETSSPHRAPYISWLRGMYGQVLGRDITKIGNLSASELRSGADKIVAEIKSGSIQPFKTGATNA